MMVVTGEELLRGVYPDAHTCFITRTLHLLGGHCVGSMTVDDRPEDIQEALGLAARKVRLVIVTGGLGPTVNDVTRGAVAGFTGIRLEENPEALAELERRFQQPRDQLRANLRRQTLVPVSGTFLKNAYGTAVGLVFEKDDLVIVSLPGPPRELQPMVNNEMVPYLRRKFGVRSPGSMLTLRFVGIGQSQIDQVLAERVRLSADVVVSSLFADTRVDFIFALPGRTDSDLARLKDIENRVRAQLGEYLYASDGSSLEEQVVRLFQARGGTLALVEAGSGGHLSASLDSVDDIGRLLAAAWAAPSDTHLRQVLAIPPGTWSGWKPGAERVRGMGEAACKLAQSRWAVVVGEVERAADGSSFVWLGWGSAEGPWAVEKVSVSGSGETAHASLTTRILDRLRRQLAKVQTPPGRP
jgi:nicotinamide-nucleotide amidase